MTYRLVLSAVLFILSSHFCYGALSPPCESECTQPAPLSASVYVQVSGLQGSVTLNSHSEDSIENSTITQDGQYLIASPMLYSDNFYSITVTKQPAEQVCTVSNASGSLQNTIIASVNCTTNKYGLNINVSGLYGSVILESQSGQQVERFDDGSFLFEELLYGANYNVSVVSLSEGLSCSFSQGSGIISSHTTLSLTCAATLGTLTIKELGIGNFNQVVKVTNGADTLSLMPGDERSFSTQVPYGATFNVQITEQATNHRCTVVNGQGTMSSSTPKLYLACKNYKKIHAGINAVCAINQNANIECNGNSYLSPGTNPAGTYKEVAVGYQHACALKTDNTLACWGNNAAGQVNAPSGNYITVAASHNGSCAINTNEELVCWGSIVNPSYPTPTSPVWDVDLSYAHGCAIGSDLSTQCWGNDYKGRATPPENMQAFNVVVSDYFSCAIQRDDRIAQCWGKNQYDSASPIEWEMADIDLGYLHGCGLPSGHGIALCWGLNSEYTPALEGNYQHITSGNGFVCAMKADYTVQCSGSSNPLE